MLLFALNWAEHMGRAHGNQNGQAMLYKYLFFFSSYLEKKYDPIGDPYTPAYAVVSGTITVNVCFIVNIVCILFIKDDDFFDKWMGIVLYLMGIMYILSTLYFRYHGRRNKIYEEIRQTTARQKIRYGIWCLLYVILSFGLWFASNDVINVLGDGPKPSYAKKIVEVLNLSRW